MIAIAGAGAGASPDGRRPGDAAEPPFERKFLVDAAQADDVVAWAAANLNPDPHAAPGCGGTYRVTSLYLDTEDLAVYRRLGSHGRAKYRVRRYDDGPSLFLERKCKVEGRVRKRRTTVPGGELSWLAGEPPEDWPALWFARRVAARRLVPACLVAYRRVAHVGEGPRGAIRLTVDREFLCGPARGLTSPRIDDGTILFPGRAIVELKYRGPMPSAFKGLIRSLALVPARASKYRAAVEACVLPGGPGGRDA